MTIPQYKSLVTQAMSELQVGDTGVLMPLAAQKRVANTAWRLGMRCATRRENTPNGLMVRVWRTA